MANAQLVDYIRREIAAGIAKDEITKVLATTGWQQDAITEAFASLPAMGAGLPGVQVQTPTTMTAGPVAKESHMVRWLLIGGGVLLLAGLGAFGAYAFGLFTPKDTSPAPVVTPQPVTPLPVATSTSPAPVATTTVATTTPVTPVATSTPPIPGVAVACTTQDCFITRFATCAPATYAADLGVLSAAEYKIIGTATGGCSMSFTYTKNVNPQWANKTMTCTFDNKLEFKASVENTFTLALAGKSSCVGPLATLLKTVPKQ